MPSFSFNLQKGIFLSCLAFMLASCGGEETSKTSNNETGTKSISVSLSANYGTSASASNIASPKTTPKVAAPSDPGVSRTLTPSDFKVAFRKLVFVNDSDNQIPLISDKSTLESSEVINLSQPYSAFPNFTLPDGTYTRIEAEIYYYEISLNVDLDDDIERVRVYLSDDDFTGQTTGKPHHQGDIVLVNASGVEIGWPKAGDSWENTKLNTVDRSQSNGAGGTDAETGHQRGLFGDADLWNNGIANVFNPVQGPNQDIFSLSLALPQPLVITSSSSISIQMTFNVQDSWQYEDYDLAGSAGYGRFNPCLGGQPDTTPNLNSGDTLQDACWSGATWAPIFNTPTLTVQ